VFILTVRGNEGDAYPLGALPVGTQVHCIEQFPGKGSRYVHAAGTFATIIRHIGDHVILQMPTKQEISFSQECMAVIGEY
jgi:large subunit ribosomal protein L2